MIFKIVKSTNFQNFTIWKISKFIKKNQIRKTKIRLQKFANFEILRPFDAPRNFVNSHVSSLI